VARPIPLLPPMTSATLPSNRSGKLVTDDLEPDLAAARGARLNVKVPKPRRSAGGSPRIVWLPSRYATSWRTRTLARS